MFDASGRPMDERQVLLTPKGAGRLAVETLRALREAGADANETLRRELADNEEYVKEVLQRLGNSSESSQIERYNELMQALLEYASQLRRVYVPQSSMVDGALQLVKSEVGMARQPVYLAMFSPYSVGAGAMKPRAFQDKNQLVEFMSTELGINPKLCDEVVAELDSSRTNSIQGLKVPANDLKRLGLL